MTRRTPQTSFYQNITLSMYRLCEEPKAEIEELVHAVGKKKRYSLDSHIDQTGTHFSW